MTTRTSTALTALLASLFLMACSEESTSNPSTPQLQSMTLAQVSAGGGASGYDLYYSGVRVGALLVTNGAFDAASGYYDQMEYWRWDSSSLVDLADGDLDDIDIDFVGTTTTWSTSLVANFENGTGTWTAWEVNRLFDLQNNYSVVWNQPTSGEILYRTDADAWAGVTGTIRYYLKMDFNYGNAYPEMFWYVSYSDYQRWLQSEAYDGDNDGIYEVRLTDDALLEQTTVGVGYELKTVK